MIVTGLPLDISVSKNFVLSYPYHDKSYVNFQDVKRES